MIRTMILKTNTLNYTNPTIVFPGILVKKNINQNSTIIQLATQTCYGLQIIDAMYLEDGGDSIPNK